MDHATAGVACNLQPWNRRQGGLRGAGRDGLHLVTEAVEKIAQVVAQ
jgi:hypothetical protein